MAGYGGFPAHNQDSDGYYGNGNQAQFRQYPFHPVQYGMHPLRPFSPQKSSLCAFPSTPQFLENCDPGYQFESHFPNFSSPGDAPDYFPPPPTAPPPNIPPHDAGAAFSISGAPVRYPAQHVSFRGRGFMRGNRGRSGALGRPFDNNFVGNTFESADKQDVRRPSKSQQFYCDLCKISCAGPLAFRDHQAGQRHKKRLAQSEAAEKLKSVGDADSAIPPMAKKRKTNKSVGTVHELRCPLCDVSCTGVEAYTAHINGKQHQKTLRLHRDLGKPIPSTDIPQLAAAATAQSNGGDAKPGQEEACQKGPQPGKETAESSTDDGGGDPKPMFTSPLATVGKPAVGEEYIEVDVAASAKSMHYRCKLCDCQFSADAKILHVKGRRHRLQYKNKVDPSLEVEQNKGGSVRRLMSVPPQRDLPTDTVGDQHGARIWDFMPAFNAPAGSMHQTAGVGLLGNCMPVYPTGGAGPVRLPMALGALPPMPGQTGPPQPPTLIVESRCVMSKHSSLLPTEAECQAMKAVIGVCEHGLKRISDTLVQQMTNDEVEQEEVAQASDEEQAAVPAAAAAASAKDRRGGKRPLVPNEALRLLRGVVRVGALGQGLLLRGEHSGDLILVCSEWPTAELIRYLTDRLPDQIPAPERPMHFEFQSSPELGLITIVASPKPEENKGDEDAVAEEPKEERRPEKDGGKDEVGEMRKSGSSGWRGRRTDTEKWPVITVRIQLTSPVIHDEQKEDEVSTSLDRAGHESSTDRAGEAAPRGTSRPSTGLSNHFALAGPTGGGTLITRQRCLEAFDAIYQAKWFQSKFNRPGLTVVARVVRDFVMSNPSWRGLNEFATLALLDRLLSVDCYSPSPAPGTAGRAPAYSGFPSNHRGTAPARLLRRFFESVGSGLLLQIPQPARQATKAAAGDAGTAAAAAPSPTPASRDQAGDNSVVGEPSQPAPQGEEVSSTTSTMATATLSSCYPIDLFGRLSVAAREQITREAQFMLRQIAFRQMYKVLRMVPYSRPAYSQKDSSLSAEKTPFSSLAVGVEEEGRDCCDVDDVVEDDGNDVVEDLTDCSPGEEEEGGAALESEQTHLAATTG